MRNATIVATLDRRLISDEAIAAASSTADWLELRADRAGDVDAGWLRERFSGTLLYTLLSHGPCAPAGPERNAALKRAAREFDLVTLEPQDLVPSILKAVPASQRVIVRRTAATDLESLRAKLQGMTRVDARLYRLEVEARHNGDELAPLLLLAELDRDDVTAFATGPIGTWSRIVAPRLAAPIVFGRVGRSEDDEGALPLEKLTEDYDFPRIHPAEELFGMAGNPVAHSLSPRIHNAAYRELGRRSLYVPFHVEDYASFWRHVVESGALDRLGLPLRGLSVVSPFKATILGAAARRTAIVDHACSANILRRDEGVWTAETTDAEGVMLTLREHGVVCRNRRVAVVGCGGSGRAMAAALHQAGAEVTLVNRGFDRGSLAVRLLHLPYMPLAAFSPEHYSVVVNATPVGRSGDDLPFPVEKLARDAVVVDLVYRDEPTELIRRTRGPGRVTIDGLEMLLTQAARQFRLLTGDDMPEGVAQAAIGISEEMAAQQF